MSALIGALRVSLSADTAAFEQGMARARNTANKTAGGIKGAFGGIGGTLAAAAGGFVAALSIGTIVAAGKAALDYAGHLGELADTLGLTTKDLQEFSYAAGQVGISQEDLEAGIQKLTISMGKAQVGSQAQIKAFNAIGISIDQLKGKNAGDVFRMIAEKLQTVSDRSQRAAIEVALFGKAGAKLDNLLSGSQGRLDDLSKAAEKLGIVLSDSQIQKADATADKIAALQTVLKARIAGEVADNANAILNLATAISQLTASVVRFLSSNPGRALAIMGALAGGRVAGLPGAAIGAVAGAAYGDTLSPDFNPMDKPSIPLLRHNLEKENNSLKQMIAARSRGESVDAAAQRAQNAKVLRLAHRLNTALGRGTDVAQPALASVDLGQFLAPSPSKPKADHSAEDLQRKQLDALRKSYDFSRDELSAQKDILEARKDLSTNLGDQTDLQMQIFDKDREIYKAELDYQVQQNKISKGQEGITQAQADKRLALYDQAAGLKREKVLQDEDIAKRQAAADLTQHDFELKQEMLQKQAALATTQSERRQIELELLELAYKEKRQALDRIIAESKDANEIAKARQDLGALNANHALDRKSVMDQTAGPLEAWKKSVPQTAAEINEALQLIEVEGLSGISDAIAGIVSGSESMGEAFRQLATQMVADITRIIVKMLILKAIQAATGGGGIPGGMDFGGAVGGLGGAPAFGELSSGALSGAMDFSGSVGAFAGVIPAFATGGGFNVTGKMGVDQNMLALNGIPIARVSHGERLSIGNDNQRADGSPVHIHMSGPMSDAQARRTGMQAAAGYQSEIARARRKGFSG
jgi:hypothetical protein